MFFKRKPSVQQGAQSPATGTVHTLYRDSRREESDIPKSALRTIQAGTMQYEYKGVPCFKNPFDLALYTLLLYKEKPRTIIEVGSAMGGSALWFADMLRTYNIDGHIYSIDIKPPPSASDPLVTFLTGNALELGNSSLSGMIESLPHPMIVVEDSAHTFDVTLATLRFFHKFLKAGDYMLVEDGIVNDLDADIYGFFDNGPNKAIFSFLNETDKSYEIDSFYCDYYGHNFTYCTNGFLRKVL
jgi:cephalosporin hydroxylase